ncbi:MAG: hypothetical protein K2I69_05125 [Muribaculaceae bacterium]|nr:hypothetical protein [Muribaculaceae bacterium]
MPRLKPGTRLAMSDGRPLVVLGFIASGGQGEVYKVRLENRIMALKWYTERNIIDNNGFLATLRYNCAQEPPSAAFIWPEGVTKRMYGSYGYVMRLRPETYFDLGKFFCIDRYPEAYFRSWLAKLTAALKICDGFSRLHIDGFSYQDLNDGNFLIHPVTGDVLICDNDNIAMDGYNNGIGGKPHYMAPEVMSGKIPNTESDRFSLAIVLYRIFMVDHPFEGRTTCSSRYVCMTPAEEASLFGKDAVFCYDRIDASNRPDERRHPNSVKYWAQLPESIRDMFCRALSRQAVRQPSLRVKASEWKRLLLRLRAELVTCRALAEDPLHDFLVDGRLPAVCPACGEMYDSGFKLRFANGSEYRVTEGKPLFFADSFVPVGYGRRISLPGGGEALALENSSRVPWNIVSPKGSVMCVEPGTMFQLVPDIEIIFPGIRAKVHV